MTPALSFPPLPTPAAMAPRTHNVGSVASRAVVSAAALESDVLPAMCSSNALTRTQSAHQLERTLPTLSAAELDSLSSAIASRLEALRAEDDWQQHAGSLLAAVHATPLDASLHEPAQEAAVTAITHAEPRVRAVAGSLLAAVARARGAAAWGCIDALVGVVQARFEIGEDQRLAAAGLVAAQEAGERAEDRKLHSVSIVHETEGWRGLETALLALRGVVEGCGREQFATVSSPDAVPGLPAILGYVLRAPGHENRFVREAGLRLFNALVGAAPAGLLPCLAKEGLSPLTKGLTDNWSQVRYAATVATHALLESLPVEDRRALYPHLLPRMCINRHYVAEGVRTLAQATWTNAIGSDGRDYLLRLLPDVVSFYETQCEADNHAVREAACQSLGEVTTKLDATTVEPHVKQIVGALIECFKDESWPVRDHACRALSAVIAAFPVASEQTRRLPELYSLFRAHLADNIPSVRANCAEALVRASSGFPLRHPVFGLRRIAGAARVHMARASAQSTDPAVAGDPARNTGYGAAAKLARDNNVALHTNQVMYSCGSLAPKLRRGGGCMDHGFSRPKQAWEEADGGAKLWRRVAAAGPDGARLASGALAEVAQAAKVAADLPFDHQMAFSEAICGEIAAAASMLDQQVPWAEGDVQKLAASVEKMRKCGHRRVQTAAAGAARALRAAVGFARYNAAERAGKEAGAV